MPIIIRNYQKTAWVNQLKKEYTVFAQGFQKILADDGVFNLSDTVLFSKLTNDCGQGTNYQYQYCAEFFDEFGKYFKILSIEEDTGYKYRDKDGANERTLNNKIVKLVDGSFITGYNFIREGERSFIYLDINGSKGPNTRGRDIFRIDIHNNGNLYSIASKDSGDIYYWKTSRFNMGLNCGKDSVSNAIRWDGCLARIMEEGWKMNY